VIASLTFINILLFGLEIIGGQNGDYETFNGKWGREKDGTQNIGKLNRERVANLKEYSLIY
jgi:hypothetical protein